MQTAAAPILAFDDSVPPGVEPSALLGGKGANLAEMARVLDLRVPPGFTITTDVCRRFLDSGWPPGFDEALDSQLARLEAVSGRRFGDPESPLLVSVRSGAPVSMPGMMDTLLNIGMTEAIRDSFAARVSPEFGADCWLRLNKMYAEIVLGVPRAQLEAAVEAQSASMAAAAVRAIAGEHGGIPDDPREQLRQAIAAVFRSWRSERATLFRRKENLPDSLGTAVTVQSMVFGNLGSNSGTGVVFTRDPATGSPGPYGDYLGGAQGEDVVAGDHAVSGLGVLAADLPGVYAELTEVIGRLEHHYRDMCDVEFTVSDGILYILQTRIGRRSPLAAVRIAVAMAEEAAFPLSRAQAVARVDAATLRQLAAMGGVDTGVKPIARGLPASPGVGTGILSCDPGRAAEMTARNIAVVLARQETSPEDVHGMIGASAIITSLGGVASHAAVVARSWAIPAVTGIAGMTVRSNGIEVDGEFVAEGETVTVDGTTGSIYVGDCRQAGHADCQELITLRAWAAELGVEPGEVRAADDSPGRSADVTLFQLARTLQLKGLATPDRLALVLSAAESRIRELLESNGTVFQPTPRGFMLTPDGRAWSAEQLAAERAAADAADLASQYEAFLELNHEFKRVVSDWQVVAREASADEAWPGLVEAVSSIDAGLRPVLDGNAAQVSRLEGYGPRFRGALEAMRGGDRTMLAAPLKDSYHTVWFEYHEELIALCGRNRADEER